MQILNGIQFTKHFIESFLVETNVLFIWLFFLWGRHPLFNSNSKVIYMQQTCCQRSSMAAHSKHRALAHPCKCEICVLKLNIEESEVRSRSALSRCLQIKCCCTLAICEKQTLLAAKVLSPFSHHGEGVPIRDAASACTFMYLKFYVLCD